MLFTRQTWTCSNRPPPLDIYQEDWPIRTYQIQGPPARTIPGKLGSEGIFINSIVAGGVVISGGTVKQSILFPNVYIGDEASVESAVLFNGVRIEEDAKVQNCIIDKDVTVPPGERVGYDRAQDERRFALSDKGIVVIPKGYRFG